jgi:Protein of unknown function (DUF3551)
MRIAFALLFSLIVMAGAGTAQADPYRWCAVYSGGGEGDGGSNCYFMTLAQCQATVSGVGGFCAPNNFYDGRPVSIPGDATERRKKRLPQ